MGLVDYSDSESDSETVTKPTPTPGTPAPSSTAGGKKPFQKVVDRARPGKILVNLPQSSSARNESNDTDGPPAKRARIAARGGGGGAFSGFNSLLPPPKNAGKPAATNSSSGAKNAPKPGVNLKTGAAPGFSREANDDGDADHANNDKGGGMMNLPAPKAQQQQQPSIPAEQKAAEDVKLVGKPLMFKPLSVSRKPAKKNTVAKLSTPASAAPPKTPDTSQASKPAATAIAGRQAEGEEGPPAPAPQKKVSLFSISTDSDPEPAHSSHDSVYEPLFAAPDHHVPSPLSASAFAAYDAANSSFSPPSAHNSNSNPSPNTNTLDQIATEMNLSASARRELFGRAPSSSTSAAIPDAKVISFDTTREYEHNEALRASGEQDQQGHNPVRAIAPGKHSLRQLVNQVHNQRDALEESFAKGRSTQREAGARYGWR
ncbi:mitotic checkpoint regulator, MAD2B-interacting-domain-containing protein [Biscogniauxia sp. FL1348]|nr:mitotic checkpoint regulator, MAD2B-interacting-domain-containing protein [Biscogniauxia sp. FL1348]